jgi:8-oxo-dGTP diphosphatase
MNTEFRFCPSCGAALEPREIEGRRLPACPKCEFIGWKGPKVATALLASDPMGRLLMIRRGISPGLGGWAFPGGYVDDEEDPVAGAARECREETGCEAQVDELTGAFHVITEDGGLVVLAYRGRVTGGEPRPTDEAPELGWFDPQRLPYLVFTSHRQALSAWRADQVRVT